MLHYRVAIRLDLRHPGLALRSPAFGSQCWSLAGSADKIKLQLTTIHLSQRMGMFAALE